MRLKYTLPPIFSLFDAAVRRGKSIQIDLFQHVFYVMCVHQSFSWMAQMEQRVYHAVCA